VNIYLNLAYTFRNILQSGCVEILVEQIVVLLSRRQVGLELKCVIKLKTA
jgi:hypothetical protein